MSNEANQTITVPESTSTIHRTRRSMKRIQKWDILKAFLIFCVVLGHVADNYTDSYTEMRGLYFFIYIFHMPLFIFVSGLFAKKSINRNRIDKILGYLALYVIMKGAFLAYSALFYHNFNLTLLTEKTVPWFMLVLPIHMGITMLVKRLSPKYVLLFSVFLACLAGYEAQIGDFLAMSRVIVYYPFYYLGYILNREAVEKLCRKPSLKIISLVIIVLTAVIVIFYCEDIYWIRPLLTGRNSFYQLEHFALWGWLCRLLYYLLATLVCAAVVILIPDRTPLGLIGKMGQQTLGVFVFHPFVLSYILNILGFGPLLPDMPPLFGIWNTLIFSLIVTLVLSVPFFTVLVQRVMNIPMRPVARKN